MIERKRLLNDLQKLLPKIEADLLERSESAEVPDVGRTLREEFTAAQAADRTAQNFEDWRSDAITQVAAAWVLSCVFVRFLEDNQLVPTPKTAGPGDGLKRARDEHELYFRSHPTLNDRDYLLAVFDGLTKYAATKEVFGAHNPIRGLPNWLSGDAAGALITFFQRVDPNAGVLVHDFIDPEWDTRFLGDLYQDLSEEARKKFSLLQTPEFVEEFILDRTLNPAIEEFGLAKVGYEARLLPDGRLHEGDRFKMIDPACGSGHFLLGSFARLVDRWRKKDPGAKVSLLVQRALDGIHGVDVNPYAIAIAWFRVLLTALKECGITRLSDAPGFDIHLTCGDSLLHGSPGGDQLSLGWSSIDHVYQPENKGTLDRLLRPGRYHAVVANPPYNVPNDSSLNAGYRDRYATCHRQYSLAVPFLERIFTLCTENGFTGQITANGFMKREFGKKLIEAYFRTIDLTHVIDTRGVVFGNPGFGGTSTVILFGRNRPPVSRSVRTVMGLRGEPGTPETPSHGLVWSAIKRQVDQPDTDSELISVRDLEREKFLKHPWSIGRGGASKLKDEIEGATEGRLADSVEAIGRTTVVGEDDAWVMDESTARRKLVAYRSLDFCVGDVVRDWTTLAMPKAIYPYKCLGGDAIDFDELYIFKHLWPFRSTLDNRTVFGKSLAGMGRPWWEHLEHYRDKLRTPLSIVFSFLATHNNFVLDRGGRLFKQTAPIIKLAPDASVVDHLRLLGVLNSSLACFWMKQVFHSHGAGGGTRVKAGKSPLGDDNWESHYEHDSTKIKQLPIPDVPLLREVVEIDSRANLIGITSPMSVLDDWATKAQGRPPRDALSEAKITRSFVFGEMIRLQEELDWKLYRLYGLVDDDLTTELETLSIKLGQRAFEIVLARKVASGETQTTWFKRHGSIPITQIPAEWPDGYRRLVERRIGLIESDPNVRLLEQPEYKRRWNTESWESQLERAVREWLLDRLESYFDFDGRMNDEGKPTARLPNALATVGKLADIARRDPDFLQVGELYRDDPVFDVTKLVAELVEGESVPLLPILRYKRSGLRKREEWENTWTLQRREDAIDARTTLPKDDPRRLSELDAKELKKKEVGTIPVPPKYTSADFLKSDYWRLRGKLDVPKERWVSFPHCEGEDGSLTIAWAGYDHLQLARAISAYYVDVQERLGGRDDPRLVPLVACLIELLPWIKQWHNEIDPEFGVRMGEYFEGFIQEEARQLQRTLTEIRAWEPTPRATRNPRGRKKKAQDGA